MLLGHTQQDCVVTVGHQVGLLAPLGTRPDGIANVAPQLAPTQHAVFVDVGIAPQRARKVVAESATRLAPSRIVGQHNLRHQLMLPGCSEKTDMGESRRG